MLVNFWRILFCLTFALVSYGLFSEPSSESGFEIPDYLLHFSAFFLLSFFLTKSSNFFIALVLIGLYAPITEIIQFFLPYRDATLLDLFFNYLGIFFSFFYLKFIENSL
tara:strand:+ start:149 stop:475 length:327 start_codon:yes stop_codon:yes gene_type:complete